MEAPDALVDKSHVSLNASPPSTASMAATVPDEKVSLSGELIHLAVMPRIDVEDDAVKDVGLPALPPGTNEDGDGGLVAKMGGSLDAKKMDLREIPDSDAVSPLSSLESPGEERNGGEETGLGGGHERVVESEEEHGLVKSDVSKEKEQAVKIAMGAAKEENGAAAEETHLPEEASTELMLSVPALASLGSTTLPLPPVSETEQHQPNEIHVSQALEASSAPRSSLANPNPFFEEAFACIDAAKHDSAQSSNPFVSPEETEMVEDTCYPLPLDGLNQAPNGMLSSPDDLDTPTTDTPLLIEGVSFLHKVLLAEEAAAATEIFSPVEDNQPVKKALPFEIPPSDEEDAMHDDKDPLPNFDELYTTHGSASKSLDTIFMNVEAAKHENEPMAIDSSAAEREATIMAEATPTEAMNVDLTDAAPLNRDVSSLNEATLPAVNPPTLRATEEPTCSAVMDLDSADASRKKNINTDRANDKEQLPESEPELEAAPQPAKRLRGRGRNKSKVKAMESAPEVQEEVNFDVEPGVEAEAGFAPEYVPIIQASLDNSDEQSKETFPPMQAPNHSTTPPTQQNGHDIQAPNVAADPSKIKGRSQRKTSATPNASFTTPNGSIATATAATPEVVKPNTSSAAADGLQSKRKLESVSSKASLSSGEDKDGQDADVLFAELKAMKISSIQARNASLQAEIAAKRAKLKEVTRELRNPAAEIVKRHIKLLHDYNDIRDVGQGLVGMIADNRGVRIGELYDEFGVGLKD